MKIYIYVLTELDGVVRYVGKSNEYRIGRRIVEHCRPSSLKYHTHKNMWIKSLLKEDIKPILKIIEECDELNYREREKYWVDYYRKNSIKKLTNSTEGGEGAIRIPNRTISMEQRKKIGETWKKHPKFFEICTRGGKNTRGIKRSFKFKQTSDHIGINKIKKTGRWRCYIHHNGKPLHIGCYLTEIEAVDARKLKLSELGYN